MRQKLLLHLLLLDDCALFLNALLLSLYFQIESLNCNTKVLFFQPKRTRGLKLSFDAFLQVEVLLLESFQIGLQVQQVLV